MESSRGTAPIDVANPTSADRSPYEVSLKELIGHFGKTAERRAILRGFLDYRLALHNLGLIDGFQWLDGSFIEHIEAIEGRNPNDIDVVSFFSDTTSAVNAINSAAAGGTPINLDVLDHDLAKNQYKVDSYILELDQIPTREVVSWTAYWYSMWSHRRTQSWKGFLQVDLAPLEDSDARDILDKLDVGGVTP